MSYPELEIGLHRAQADSYQLQLRFTDPAIDAEHAAGPSVRIHAADLPELRGGDMRLIAQHRRGRSRRADSHPHR